MSGYNRFEPRFHSYTRAHYIAPKVRKMPHQIMWPRPRLKMLVLALAIAGLIEKDAA